MYTNRSLFFSCHQIDYLKWQGGFNFLYIRMYISQWIIWKIFEKNNIFNQREHVTTMHACYLQGILDNQFHSVQALKTEENPHFVLETVTGFCNDADNGIAQMTRYLLVFISKSSNLRLVSCIWFSVLSFFPSLLHILINFGAFDLKSGKGRLQTLPI